MNMPKIFFLLVLVILIAGVGYVYFAKSPSEQPRITEPSKTQVVVQSGGAGLLIAECQDRNYIYDTATNVIAGRVKNVENKWDDARTSIFTYSDISIANQTKGEIAGDKIRIVTPGGEVDGIGQAVEDQPIFHEGRAVKIYLQKTESGFSIVCANRGVEEL